MKRAVPKITSNLFLILSRHFFLNLS